MTKHDYLISPDIILDANCLVMIK